MKDSLRSKILALLSIDVFARTSITLLVSDALIPYCLSTDEAISALSAIDIFVAAARSIVHLRDCIISVVENHACHSIVIPSAASLAVNFDSAPSFIARSVSSLYCFLVFSSSQKSQSTALASDICFSNSPNLYVAAQTAAHIVANHTAAVFLSVDIDSLLSSMNFFTDCWLFLFHSLKLSKSFWTCLSIFDALLTASITIRISVFIEYQQNEINYLLFLPYLLLRLSRVFFFSTLSCSFLCLSFSDFALIARMARLFSLKEQEFDSRSCSDHPNSLHNMTSL